MVQSALIPPDSITSRDETSDERADAAGKTLRYDAQRDRHRMQRPQRADWRGMLESVKAFLHTTQAPAASGTPNAAAHGAGEISVTECIAALDRLYLTLKHNLARQQALERELRAARMALTNMHAELFAAQAKERSARKLALHDSLTALPNRSFFLERLAEALQRAALQRRALAVLYLDLDGFKPINDVHGHATGDELLRIMATRLSRALRTEDTVGRLGGDEFACLLADFPSRACLRDLAHKIFDTVTAPCKLGAFKLSVRASIGVAVYPADGESVERLLAHADAAMYSAKRARCGVTFFDQRAVPPDPSASAGPSPCDNSA